MQEWDVPGLSTVPRGSCSSRPQHTAFLWCLPWGQGECCLHSSLPLSAVSIRSPEHPGPLHLRLSLTSLYVAFLTWFPAVPELLTLCLYHVEPCGSKSCWDTAAEPPKSSVFSVLLEDMWLPQHLLLLSPSQVIAVFFPTPLTLLLRGSGRASSRPLLLSHALNLISLDRGLITSSFPFIPLLPDSSSSILKVHDHSFFLSLFFLISLSATTPVATGDFGVCVDDPSGLPGQRYTSLGGLPRPLAAWGHSAGLSLAGQALVRSHHESPCPPACCLKCAMPRGSSCRLCISVTLYCVFSRTSFRPLLSHTVSIPGPSFDSVPCFLSSLSLSLLGQTLAVVTASSSRSRHARLFNCLPGLSLNVWPVYSTYFMFSWSHFMPSLSSGLLHHHSQPMTLLPLFLRKQKQACWNVDKLFPSYWLIYLHPPPTCCLFYWCYDRTEAQPSPQALDSVPSPWFRDTSMTILLSLWRNQSFSSWIISFSTEICYNFSQ